MSLLIGNCMSGKIIPFSPDFSLINGFLSVFEWIGSQLGTFLMGQTAFANLVMFQ